MLASPRCCEQNSYVHIRAEHSQTIHSMFSSIADGASSEEHRGLPSGACCRGPAGHDPQHAGFPHVMAVGFRCQGGQRPAAAQFPSGEGVVRWAVGDRCWNRRGALRDPPLRVLAAGVSVTTGCWRQGWPSMVPIGANGAWNLVRRRLASGP
jgi:hypothetical protein